MLKKSETTGGGNQPVLKNLEILIYKLELNSQNKARNNLKTQQLCSSVGLNTKKRRLFDYFCDSQFTSIEENTLGLIC